ncbi:hypothetical protein TVAG_168740 [Trichomonas vaginalis G3]|uniref:Uncharacterized protein n=1 Tax=Trichomonas vaginalis (strain ATCC PRA-98 / G3) TaxID=412133 RepID=A2FHE8_TRIV3|nr:hypothetical protein TVAGG3_0451200 [Trichomonas vaginalis G3]EAX95665.1 hypothetical protein TVAG_168740 [Trichomonas vaginalis G3]KAI5538167.1 hypothetical protein TVAGG3_0451200 [Trichomonas vaginalis G3]|eukprot:XP_001308595.1 hypothetical protein [Trichomonas vaginalis G3]
MSLHKISSLLEQNESIINVNLYSDQLKSILDQIVDMVSHQEQQINNLENVVKTKAEIHDIEKINNSLSTFNEAFVRDLIDKSSSKISESIENLNKYISETIETKNNATNVEIKKLETTFTERFITNEQNLGIQGQRINDLSKNSRYIFDKIDEYQNNFTTIEQRLKKLEDKSEDALIKRIDGLELIIENIKQKTEADIKQIDGKITEALNQISADRTLNDNKMKDLGEKIIDIQGKIAADSLIQLELKDPLDASMIIHTIQRNDRRVDLLNQSFIATQNACDDQSKFFNGIHRCLIDLSKEVALLNNDLNLTKEQIPSCLKNSIHDILKLKSKIDAFLETSNASFKATATALNDLNDRLVETEELTKNKSTTKMGFTDIINSLGRAGSGFQKLIDDQTKFLAKSSDITLEPTEKHTISIPTLNIGKEVEVETDDRAAFEIEMNQKFSDLVSRLETEVSQTNEFKKEITTLMDKKADLSTIDRILEKMKSSINQMKEKLNHINTKQPVQIQPDTEPESYLRSKKLKSYTAHTSQSALGKPLPPLPTSAQAYDIIYK